MPVRSMTIDVTGKCQNRCRFCYTRDKESVMAFERFKGLVDGFPSLERVEVGGGEPLLNPDLSRMAAYLLSKKLRTDISTNGLIYPECIVRLAAGELLSLQVNFPAGEENAYDLVTRTSEGFPTLLENVKRLAATGLRTRLRLTICPENASQLVPVFHIANGLNLPLIVAPALPVKGNPAQMLETDEIDELHMRAMMLKMRHRARLDFLWSHGETPCPAVAKAYRLPLRIMRCSADIGEKVHVDPAGIIRGCEFLG